MNVNHAGRTRCEIPVVKEVPCLDRELRRVIQEAPGVNKARARGNRC